MIGAVVVVQAGTQAQPADEVLDLAVVEAFVLVGWARYGGRAAVTVNRSDTSLDRIILAI